MSKAAAESQLSRYNAYKGGVSMFQRRAVTDRKYTWVIFLMVNVVITQKESNQIKLFEQRLVYLFNTAATYFLVTFSYSDC